MALPDPCTRCGSPDYYKHTCHPRSSLRERELEAQLREAQGRCAMLRAELEHAHRAEPCREVFGNEPPSNCCRIGKALTSTAATVKAHDEKVRAEENEAALKECDRFLDELRGRKDDRGDGAYVAITRLRANLHDRTRRRAGEKGEPNG